MRSGVARPHAAIAATSSAYTTMAYDPNGNLIAADNGTYTFDAENRVMQRDVRAATTDYTYDGAGTMLKRRTTGVSGSESTVYIGGSTRRTRRRTCR
jgi:YD repeat-containing protein